MANTIYMNNAATGWPKFDASLEAMSESLRNGVMSANRDSIGIEDAQTMIFNLRTMLGNMMHAKEPHEIILTPSDTIAINMILHGMDWHFGDIILVDDMAHNAVARPTWRLVVDEMVQVSYIHDADDVRKVIHRKGMNKVKACVCTHASNVTGDVMDIEAIGEVCKDNDILFIIDAAQSLGVVDVDVEKVHASAVAFAGHKVLNGPQGTGGFYLRKGFDIKPSLWGGTGNESVSIDPLTVYPDSFEVGTPAMHDLIGLYYAVKEIEDHIDRDLYANKLRELGKHAYDALSALPNVILYGDERKQTPVVSFNVKGYLASEVGEHLGKYGIVCRTGVHCAGLAHKRLGTIDAYGGTVRVSFGWFNSAEHITTLVDALKELPIK